MVPEGRLVRPHARQTTVFWRFDLRRVQERRRSLRRSVPDIPHRRNSGRKCRNRRRLGDRRDGWSLDSDILYLLLDTDGFRCLWAQRVDPATGALIGAPCAAQL